MPFFYLTITFLRIKDQIVRLKKITSDNQQLQEKLKILLEHQNNYCIFIFLSAIYDNQTTYILEFLCSWVKYYTRKYIRSNKILSCFISS